MPEVLLVEAGVLPAGYIRVASEEREALLDEIICCGRLGKQLARLGGAAVAIEIGRVERDAAEGARPQDELALGADAALAELVGELWALLGVEAIELVQAVEPQPFGVVAERGVGLLGDARVARGGEQAAEFVEEVAREELRQAGRGGIGRGIGCGVRFVLGRFGRLAPEVGVERTPAVVVPRMVGIVDMPPRGLIGVGREARPDMRLDSLGELRRRRPLDDAVLDERLPQGFHQRECLLVHIGHRSLPSSACTCIIAVYLRFRCCAARFRFAPGT